MKPKTYLLRRYHRMRGHIDYRGLTVALDPLVVTDQILDSLRKGDYEVPELQALSGLMRPGDRVLELGAGMGLVSGVMAKRHPQARFVSYEANSALAPVIKALHQLNGIGNVDLRSAIVAPLDQGATRRFRLHRHFTEGSLVAQSADQGETEVAVHDPVAVIAELKPDLLLCDIEGGEEELIPLLPMAGLRAAVIELHPTIVSRAGMARIFAAFHAAGLVPVVELSSATVVAFERVPAP
ncbi:MAG: FkbM family methyltransferase [Microgenomates group bacterium]